MTVLLDPDDSFAMNDEKGNEIPTIVGNSQIFFVKIRITRFQVTVMNKST